MRWKAGILIAVISFGVGVIVGYSILGGATLGNIVSFIGGLFLGLLGGSDILGFISNWFKERREEKIKKREKLEGYVHVHNQELINKIFKYWFYENNKPTTERQRTIEHLQIGYPDIWNLKLECDSHKNHLLESENRTRSNIKDKLEQHTPPGFEWDITLDNMGQLLYKSIEGFSNKGGDDENYRIHLHNFGLFGIRKIADKNDKYLMEKQENFRKLIDAIVNDKILIEQFRFISKEKTRLDEKTKQFKQCIEGIKHDFEKRYIELKGTCKDCKDLHEELKSLT